MCRIHCSGTGTPPRLMQGPPSETSTASTGGTRHCSAQTTPGQSIHQPQRWPRTSSCVGCAPPRDLVGPAHLLHVGAFVHLKKSWRNHRSSWNSSSKRYVGCSTNTRATSYQCSQHSIEAEMRKFTSMGNKKVTKQCRATLHLRCQSLGGKLRQPHHRNDAERFCLHSSEQGCE